MKVLVFIRVLRELSPVPVHHNGLAQIVPACDVPSRILFVTIKSILMLIYAHRKDVIVSMMVMVLIAVVFDAV